MSGNSDGGEVFVTASSSLPLGGDGGWSPAPSSVDSEELQELLEELHIVPARGKRPFGWDTDDSEADCSPSRSRPHASPRLDASSPGPAAAAGAAAEARLPPPPQRAPPAAEPEVIEILDSSDSDSDEEWSIAAPSTARKR